MCQYSREKASQRVFGLFSRKYILDNTQNCNLSCFALDNLVNKLRCKIQSSLIVEKLIDYTTSQGTSLLLNILIFKGSSRNFACSVTNTAADVFSKHVCNDATYR